MPFLSGRKTVWKVYFGLLEIIVVPCAISNVNLISIVYSTKLSNQSQRNELTSPSTTTGPSHDTRVSFSVETASNITLTFWHCRCNNFPQYYYTATNTTVRFEHHTVKRSEKFDEFCQSSSREHTSVQQLDFHTTHVPYFQHNYNFSNFLSFIFFPMLSASCNSTLGLSCPT